ncbi:hypothetical protein GGI42DRAFT_337650 [Trichoderma sp. SZMC 28013]
MASAAAAAPPPPPPPLPGGGPDPPPDLPDLPELPDNVPSRQCTHCKQIKPNDQFLHLRKPNALVGKCLDCRSVRRPLEAASRKLCGLVYLQQPQTYNQRYSVS